MDSNIVTSTVNTQAYADWVAEYIRNTDLVVDLKDWGCRLRIWTSGDWSIVLTYMGDTVTSTPRFSSRTNPTGRRVKRHLRKAISRALQLV